MHVYRKIQGHRELTACLLFHLHHKPDLQQRAVIKNHQENTGTVAGCWDPISLQNWKEMLMYSNPGCYAVQKNEINIKAGTVSTVPPSKKKISLLAKKYRKYRNLMGTEEMKTSYKESKMQPSYTSKKGRLKRIWLEQRLSLNLIVLYTSTEKMSDNQKRNSVKFKNL